MSSTKPADVFVLRDHANQFLSPAVQASALARYSRSPLPMRKLVAGLTEDDARAFQEKWGVTYGHSSVAELASLPFCFEGVSIIASKVLERMQRGAYSEKSTRYQEFSASSFVEPAGFPLELRDVVDALYETYHALHAPVEAYVRTVMTGDSSRAGGSPPAESVIKARVFDSLRYLLPAGTGTNLAAVLNTRDARYLMNDLLGHPLTELRTIGQSMVDAARAVAPVFAMGVEPNEHAFQEEIVFETGGQPRPGWTGIRLMEWESLGSSFWRHAARYGIRHESDLSDYMSRRKGRALPKFFRIPRFSFDIFTDYGAFRDLQRHRRCEQFPEVLTVKRGYVVPEDIQNAGVAETYRRMMDRVAEAVSTARASGIVSELHAQYAIPLAFIHRTTMIMDLEQLYYVVELRTKPQGHISYRQIAWDMYKAASKVDSYLMQWCNAIESLHRGAHT